jgi:hypothetical protein
VQAASVRAVYLSEKLASIHGEIISIPMEHAETVAEVIQKIANETDK